MLNSKELRREIVPMEIFSWMPFGYPPIVDSVVEEDVAAPSWGQRQEEVQGAK